MGVALPQERNTLRKEIRRSNVICLVYSDHYVRSSFSELMIMEARAKY